MQLRSQLKLTTKKRGMTCEATCRDHPLFGEPGPGPSAPAAEPALSGSARLLRNLLAPSSNRVSEESDGLGPRQLEVGCFLYHCISGRRGAAKANSTHAQAS